MQELKQDKDELQKQVCEQLKQLSQLRSQVSDLMLSTASHKQLVDQPTGDEDLRLKVDQLSSALEVRDKEVLQRVVSNNAFPMQMQVKNGMLACLCSS